MQVLIAGCGYVGSELGRRLAAAGHTVWGMRRRPEGLPDGLLPLAADLADPASLAGLPEGLDWVVYAAAADGFDDAAYRTAYVDGPRNLLAALAGQGQRPRRLLFVSSTGVYGQQDGEWVDEASPTEPTGFSGRRLLEGEALVAAAPFATVVLRLAGIYGPGRTMLLDRVRSAEATCVEAPPQYSNLIHRDDCAGAIAHLLALDRAHPLYLGADHEPTERCALLRWLADAVGAPPPQVMPPGSSATRRTRRGNKRCRNARLVESGYRFRYPTFREGFGDLLTGST